MTKAIFFDRDGVLNKDPGYVHKIEHYELYSDVIEGLTLLKQKGFIFFIITNQSGIGRGYYKEEDFHKFNNHLTNDLKGKGITIKKSYFCPHHPDKECDCRKPNEKYIKEAEKEFNIDLNESWVIGDHPHDIQLGKNAGTRTIYLLRGHGKKHKSELKTKPELIANSLIEAAKFVIKDGN